MQIFKQTIRLTIFSILLFNSLDHLYAQNVVAPIVSTAIANGSFESPDIPYATFQYRPSGSGWNLLYNAAISDNASGFTNATNAPAGTQALVLQQSGSASQTIPISTTGAYRFSIKAAQRSNYNTTGQVIQIQIDGITIGLIRPTTTSYQTYLTAVYSLTAGNHTLKLEGTVTTGDNTALVDDIRSELLPRWSQAVTWQGGVLPSATSTVSIPAGYAVAMDANNCVCRITNINGTLTAALNTNFSLAAECVHVQSGGLLEIGRETIPYTANGKITLVGNNPDAVTCGMMGTKFIDGMSGSRIELHGSYKKSWGQISNTANVGSNTITVAQAINWQVGDRIVIASSDFDMNHAEVRTITAVSNNITFTLDQPLNYKHFGQIQTYNSTSGTWTVDERSEVGMLSRNLVIEGDANSPDLAFGGHMMIMSGSVAHVENVELNRMGQRHKLGRYPFHWHLVGDGSGQYFNNNSVHNTYNRAITVHNTNNTAVKNNVCYDNLGHAIFLEDGNETGNIISGNLGLVTRRPAQGDALLPSDLLINRNASGPSTFWITHPSNIVQNNRAAGSDGSGFWFSFFQNPNSPGYISSLNPNILNIPSGFFDNNTAHSSYHGWLIGMAPQPNDITETPDVGNDYLPTQPPTIRGLNVYKNRLGVYSRIGANKVSSTYTQMIVADNWEGDANTWISEIDNSLWVGASLNGEQIPAGVSPSDNKEGYVIGHVLYDGPCKISNSHFAGFSGSHFSLFDQWNANYKYHGHALFNTTVAAGSYKVNFRNTDGPVWFNASITDLDGKFTGTPMTAIVRDHPIMIDNTCQRITPHQNVTSPCPQNSTCLNGVESNKRYGYVEVRTSDEKVQQGINRRQTSQLLRNDGATWTEIKKEIDGVGLSLMLNGAFQYKYIYYKNIPDVSRFDYYSMNAGEWVILEIPNVPSTAKVYTATLDNTFFGFTNATQLTPVSTLAALQSSNASAAAYIGGSMYLRFQAPSASSFLNGGCIGSMVICLSGTCDGKGPAFTLPDTDGDGATDMAEASKTQFFIRNENEVNDLSFDFNYGDAGDWNGGGNVVASGFDGDNLLTTLAIGEDPQLIRTGLNMDGNKVKYIDVRTFCQAAGNYQLFWTTADDNMFSQSKSIWVNYPVAKTWKVLRFQVGDHSLWKGKQITSLRIDPLGGTQTDSVHTLYDWIKAKNTWIFDLNKTGSANNTTMQLFDAGGNNCNEITDLLNTILGTGDNTVSFDLTDWNNDGYTDIAAFKKQATSTGMTEIYVLDGKNNYQSFLYQAATGLTYMNVNDHICLADYNGDNKPDIWCINHNSTSSNKTEIYVLDGNNPQSFLLQTYTGLPLIPNTINDFCIYDYDNDKRPDLWFIQKQGANNKTEIQILKNTTNINTTFKNFAAYIPSGLSAKDANWSFDVADYNRDGTADVVAVDRLGSDGKIDVHVLNGVGGFQSFLLETNTPMPSGNANHTYLLDDGTKATGLGYVAAPVAVTDETTSISNNIESKGFTVYPNPTTNELHIQLPLSVSERVNVRIYDMMGKLVLNNDYNAMNLINLSVSNFNKGLYLIQITSGSEVFQSKFGKE